ncbi:MAG: peptidoglycan DD-metalloendopeptidase family protein [Patescibacteria group bacterium]|nr:peptidoglycan DD-metalloendopeptidase family protein [Patescibacteria group bacterium]
MKDIGEFSSFLRSYLTSRVIYFGKNFEQLKDIIVAFLIVKRGKYSNSFLNSSFFLLIVAVLIGGPIIAENNPFAINEEDQAYQATVIAYSPDQFALGTVLSDKPRDKVEDYTVKGGDTLESIAKKFDISVDTIRWANTEGIKNDVIKPGQTIKIPPVTGVVHKVASGDNIYTIAKKYSVDPQAIVNFPFNDFADLDTFQLTPGQNLFVPGGVIEQAKPVNRGSFETRATMAQIQGGAKGTSNFIWPTSGLITQYPVWYHMALDIASNSLPPIQAADSGTVSYTGCIAWGYGCHIIIDHGNGYQSLYAHLSTISVSAGQSVSQGEQIGIMGSTGRSTGPHLHFEIRSGGGLLNPLNFLQ